MKKSQEIIGSVTCVECGEWFWIGPDALTRREPTPEGALKWELVRAEWVLDRHGDPERAGFQPTCPTCVARISKAIAADLGCPEWCDACSGFDLFEGEIQHFREWCVNAQLVASIFQSVDKFGRIRKTNVCMFGVERNIDLDELQQIAAALEECGATAERYGLGTILDTGR